jgi:glycosyltransferase involved in cell wall biosynthesis
MARIALLNRSYVGVTGGVEAQSLWLAGALSMRGHDVLIASWDNQQISSPFGIPERVQTRHLGREDPHFPASHVERYRRHASLRSLLQEQKIEVAIAYQQGMALSTLSSSFLTSTRVIAAERNSPQLFTYVKDGKRRQVATNLLAKADAVVVQWNRYRDMYSWPVRRKVLAIANPVSVPDEPTTTFTSRSIQRRLLCVGRFSYQKNQQDLLRGLAAFNAGRVEPVSCDLIGDGEGEVALRSMVDELHLQDHVRFLGPRRDWTSLLHRYDALIAPSRWEGFPNGVAEALACGVPVLGFSLCDGVSDLVSDGVNGLLEPGQIGDQGVTRLIARFIELGRPARSWSVAARESVNRFAPAAIEERWEKLIFQVCGRHLIDH